MILPIRITLGARPPLWMHKADPDLGGVRSCAITLGSCPEIFVLLVNPVELTREWQFFIRAINPGMTVRHVSAILNNWRAFANGTGFNDPKDPRKNWLLQESLEAKENPQFDKTRTCARSVLTGEAVGDNLRVLMLNGNKPPPLKPGKRHPLRVEDVNLSDYLYTPQTHPWLFFVANNIQRDGDTVPFSDDGGHYDWIANRRPVTFLPHVSPGDVLYPLDRLVKLGPNDPIPSPYEQRS